MSLRSFLQSLIGSVAVENQPENMGFSNIPDSSGINIYTDKTRFDELKSGRGSGLGLIQLVLLQMLHEQGVAEQLPNGYRLASCHAAALDNEQANILGLPERYDGLFESYVTGRTGGGAFRIDLAIQKEDKSLPFSFKGPIMRVSDNEKYLLDPPQLLALESIKQHTDMSTAQRNEAADLRLLAKLQTAQRSGMKVDLSHFDKFEIRVPDEIGVIATQLPDGGIRLCPSFGDGSSPETLDKRWGQIELSEDNGVLRVHNKIVLFEPERMRAIREVMQNRYIPEHKVEDFIKTPTAFLDASLVNLDIGFSIRVLGVGALRHIDFGADDAVKSDWFSAEGVPEPIVVIEHLVESEEDLRNLEERIVAARAHGAATITFEDHLLDISDDQANEYAIDKTREQLATRYQRKEPETCSKEKLVTATVILKELDETASNLLERAKAAGKNHSIDWEGLARRPFPHQVEGVAWISGLFKAARRESKTDPYRLQGGLLADDMGLGKTYMTLAAMSEYLRGNDANAAADAKPILVVAPLSLLENWEDEVASTFKETPFKDIVVLQGGRDLKKYRIKGADRESKQLAELIENDQIIHEAEVRYALHIGPEAGPNRLDMNRRLVLTTYQTLRDYQLSLCMIDWGLVVFDEAQNIKNPNTLQTRAAKGLKADFKLLATGTPVENSLGDFWCLMDTAQPGLLGNWQTFRERWIAPIAGASSEDSLNTRLRVGAELRAAVGTFMLRRVKEEQLQGLPEKVIYSGVRQPENSLIVSDDSLSEEMKGVQLSTYDQALQHYRETTLDDAKQNAALATLFRIRQVSLHPRLDKEMDLVTENAACARAIMDESGKLQSLLRILDSVQSQGEKVIIFLITKKLQALLKLWLNQIYGLNISVINGDTTAIQRNQNQLSRKGLIEEFETKVGFNVLIMSPVAAGVGLTVVGANHVVHLERHWNPAKEAQATDRVYRIGQTKDVNVYMPAVTHPKFDSFDVHLDRLLRGKLVLKDAVVTPDIVSEAALIESLGM